MWSRLVVVLAVLAACAHAQKQGAPWSNRRAACTDKVFATADCKCGTAADAACKKHSKCTTNLCCAPDACTNGKKINTPCTCGGVSGCAVGKVCIADDKCYSACVKSDASAKETAACACETTECAKDKFCFVKSGTGYVFDTAACAKSDASAKETAACTCGYKAGATAAVAKDEYCFVSADGTGTKVADPPCKKTDASAKEDPKCSCNGADSIVAVAKDKFCQVVAKKGYVTDSVKCKKSDASAKEDPACTCGYKSGGVAIAKDEYCAVLADGTGNKVNVACKKTDATVKEDPACNCGGDAGIVAVAKDKFCQVVAKKGYVMDP